jgi:GNAT superfamily N-acetyltransferase
MQAAIVDGAYPGLIGEIIRWHGLYYVRDLGWPHAFEAMCAEQLGELSAQLGQRADVAAFSVWQAQEFLAAVLMDARPGNGTGARLRFLITSQSGRGRRLGAHLLTRAVRWAEEAGHRRVWLTTVAGLEASAHLYRKFGFRIITESVDHSWGIEHREQVWERLRTP